MAVIGGGPGGLATAMYAGMRGLSVIAFEAQALGGQLINLYPTKPVTNFPSQPELASRDLAQRLADQARHFRAELADNEPVEFVGHNGSDYRLLTARREVTAHTLVLALGLGRFAPRKLGLQKEEWFEGRGLVYRLPPRDEITAQRIVIVGGGDSAVDTALSLHEIAEVTLVHHRDAWSALDFSVKQLESSAVKVITNGVVIELVGGERLESVIVSLTDEGALRLPTDLLFVSIGQLPDLSGIESWDLEVGGNSIAVNSAMETGIPGLYAVGDFARYPGKVKTITTAVAEGTTAANAAQMYLLAA
ncbi:MAG: NAD(P)/FAD-dependent oxidoreductase [Thermoleophilia bacterium]